jgi:DNA polymerase-3 subunit alpha
MTTITPPKKFFGLHSHSGFSTFDGLGYPQEHMDFCAENGLDGWSLTDHGQMNGFGHAQLHADKLKKAGADFKFIPGCEMYIHPDLKSWKREYEEWQDLKSNRKTTRVKLKEHPENIVTPIIAITDENDETIGVDTEGSALTIENEDETKSTKHFNPINRRHHLVVLPRHSRGLEKLFGLVSRGYSEGFYKFPRVDLAMIKEANEDDNFIISTACVGGSLAFEVFRELQEHSFDSINSKLLDDASIMERVIKRVGNSFEGLAWAVGRKNVLLELQFNRLSAQHIVNRAIMEFAKREGMTDQLVVTCDSHYARPEHWKEREIYKKLGWLNYTELSADSIPKSKDQLKCELYPKNSVQVWDEFLKSRDVESFYHGEEGLIKDAIERTWDIAHIEIGDVQPDRSVKLPSYVIPQGKTSVQALKEFVADGMKKKGFDKNPVYVERASYELDVIEQKDFSTYFLTMREIIMAAKEEMFVGVGRGSSCGSLVCYVLGITEIDPIKYDLLFERFLSPDREGLPDIDTDVEDREKLMMILRKKFGTENVIPISNYNTFKLKTLIRDVSRLYDIPLEDVNVALKTVEKEVLQATKKTGDDKNLFVLTYDDAYEHSPSFKSFIDKYPHVSESIKVLFRQNKALGRHAGGVIISERIAERMPLIMARGEQQTPWVEGMNYKHLEMLGWVKFDLLGLETLRMIRRTIELILQNHHGIKNPTFKEVKLWFDQNMATDVIDFNDQKTYENVYHEATSRTPGVFQLTSQGAQRLFKNAKPRSIIDIATLTSVFRPGPLAAKVDKLYLESKADPKAIDYKHPLIKQVLEPTYGCIIFQEQLMSLCNIVAGFPKSECDKVRKNILKRTGGNPEESKKKALAMKQGFVDGSVKNGIRESVASKLWDDILYFAGYGFNLSHALAYAVDSYYCAWLLTYYESEWLCAYMESMIGNPDNRAEAISDVKKMGYEIGNVDINISTNQWSVDTARKILIPSFSTIKGVGETAIDEILACRPYKSIEEMLWKPDGQWRPSKFTRRSLDALIKSNAFESMDVVGEGKLFSSWKQMHHVLIENSDAIKKWAKKDPLRGKNKFKELLLETEGMPEWTRREIATAQVETLGKLDPLSLIPPELKQKFKDREVASVDTWGRLDVYWFIVTGSTEKKTKNGKPYLLLQIVGESGSMLKMFMWDWDGKLSFEPYTLCVAEVDCTDFGMSTKGKKIKVM